MTIVYEETAPLEQTFYTPRGDRAAGYWLFFIDSLSYPTLRDAYYRDSGQWKVLPNPVQLNNAGQVGVRVFYKIDTDNLLDQYTLELKTSPDFSSAAIMQYADVPRAFTSATIDPTNIVGYPPISSGDVGDILTIIIDSSSGSKVGSFEPQKDSSIPLYGLCNSVLSGLAISVVVPGTAVAITAGKALFVTLDSGSLVSTVVPVNFNGIANLPIPTVTTNKSTYLYAHSDGSITSSSSLTANTEYGNVLLLAVLEHVGSDQITMVSYKALSGVALAKQVADIYDTMLPAYSTCIPSKSSSGSSLDISGGTYYGRGVGAPNYARYSAKSMSAGTAVPVFLRSFDDTQGSSVVTLDSTVLVKDDGTAVTIGNVAFFPIFQSANGNVIGTIVIQKTNKDYSKDDIPQFEEWIDSFRIAPSLVQNYAMIGGIKFVGGSTLGDAGNSVFRVDSNGRRLADITTETQVPTLPVDGSMANKLLRVSDDGLSYGLTKFPINDNVDPNYPVDLALTYDVVLEAAVFKAFPTNAVTPTNPVLLSFDRPYSYVYQDHGILKQRKSNDNVPLLISQFVAFNRYNGNYIFDISRGYSSTFTENNTADGASRHLRIDDVITNVGAPVDFTKIVPATLFNITTGIPNFSGPTNTYGLSPSSSYKIDAGYALDVSNYIWTKLSSASGILSTIQTGHVVLGDFKIGPVDEAIAPEFYESSTICGADQYDLVSSSVETSISSQNTTTNPIRFKYGSSKISIGSFQRQYSFVGLLAVWKTAIAPTAFDITVTCNIKIDGDWTTITNNRLPLNTRSAVYAIDIFIPNADGTTLPVFDSNLSSSTFTAGGQFLLVYNVASPNSNFTSIDICTYSPTLKTSSVIKSFTAVSDLNDFFKNTGITLKSKYSSTSTTTYSDPRYAVANSKYFYASIRSVPFAPNGTKPQILDLKNSSSPAHNFTVNAEITIDGIISDTSDHIRIDFGLLKSFNSAVTTGAFRKGDRADDIVVGVIHLVLLVVKKGSGTAVPKLEFNPHSIRPNIPQLALWISSSQQVICDLTCIEVQRCVYSVNVTQTLLDSGVVVCRFFGGVIVSDLANYDISIGVLNRESSN